MNDPIDAMARRVRGDPFFLASALEDFCRSEELDRHGLAAALGCSKELLGPLGLCRRPRAGSQTFWSDVDRIARQFEIAAETLAEVVRRAEALAALRSGEVGTGMLAAARDRMAEDASPGAGEKEPP